MKLIAAFMLTSCVSSATVQSDAWTSVVKLANEVSLTAAPLDFESFLNQLKVTKPNSQSQQLNQLSKRLQRFKPKGACQLGAVDALNHGIRAQRLFEQLHQEWYGSEREYTGSLYALDATGRWFQWMSLVWLGDAVTADVLYQVGESDFAVAIKKLRKVTTKLRNKKDQDKTQVLDASDDVGIQQAYRAMGLKMKKHFAALFIEGKGFDELKVARSLQGDDFPAPGYYDPANQTMYYHPQTASYDLAQVPWLYLHEGMPGHHYQNMMANAQLNCDHLGLQSEWLQYGRMAWVEGWAAYVETLGKALGVLDEPSSLKHVLKWEALRAMRVMIDVGIHHKGWTKQQAIEFWQQHFPEGQDELAIAIDRIQRWPMQVNTYVFGKHKITQLKNQQVNQQKNTFDVRQFHDRLLKLSGLSILFMSHFQQFQEESIQ